MAEKHTTLTAERLREILDYDPDTGIFTNRYKRGGTTKKGSPAGHLKSNGYITIQVDGKSYYAHRLVFLWMTGEFPSGQHVDHVNGNKSDNRFSNLRDVSVSANLHNQRGSKVKGYYWAKYHKKYRAQIVVNNKKIVIGAYETEEEARQAYLNYKTRENLNTKRFMTQ